MRTIELWGLPIKEVEDWSIEGGVPKIQQFKISCNGTFDRDAAEKAGLFKQSQSRIRFEFQPRYWRLLRFICKIFGHKLRRYRFSEKHSVVYCSRCKTLKIYPGMYIHYECETIGEEIHVEYSLTPEP